MTGAIVVGAGVIGCSVAWQLALAGYDVTVVDRESGPGQGSTSASSAIVRLNYSTWAGVATAWEAAQAWAAWPDHVGAGSDEQVARYVRTGGLLIDPPGSDRTVVTGSFDRAGIPYEEWDAGTLKRRLPALDTGRYWPPKPVTADAFWDPADGEVTALYCPEGGFVDDPQLAARNLMAAAVRAGATFRFGETVTAITRRQRITGVALASGEHLAADVVVNVAGPHSSRVNALAGVLDDFTVSTRPMRQEVHAIAAPQGFSLDGPAPFVADVDLGTYFRPAPGGMLLLGGVEPECDPLEWVADPDAYDTNPTGAVWTTQTLRVSRRLPDLHVPHRPSGIAGLYDVTEDWVPIYDRTALDGYYVAIGTSGNQFKNAPVVGRYLAAIVAACENGHDHDRDPVRVAGTYTPHEVDLGHYSRRRPLTATTHSVLA